MKKKSIILGVLFIIFGLVTGAQNASAAVCPEGSIRAGQDVKNLALCNVEAGAEENGDDNLLKTVLGIINLVLGAAGLLAVVMVIYGGFRYATSQGNPANVAVAKNTILYSIIGLVIAMSAWLIVSFVVDRIDNTTTTNSEANNTPNSVKLRGADGTYTTRNGQMMTTK